MPETDLATFLSRALSPGSPEVDAAVALANSLGPLVGIAPGAWGTPGLAGPLPIVPAFRQEPGDYALIGQWGRGGSSEALYVIERRGPHRAFLRLPWPGGPYGDPARDRARLGEALAAFSRFHALAPVHLAASDVESNMESHRATLTWPDGRTAELLGPTPLHPDRPPFWASLATVLPPAP